MVRRPIGGVVVAIALAVLTACSAPAEQTEARTSPTPTSSTPSASPSPGGCEAILGAAEATSIHMSSVLDAVDRDEDPEDPTAELTPLLEVLRTEAAELGNAEVQASVERLAAAAVGIDEGAAEIRAARLAVDLALAQMESAEADPAVVQAGLEAMGVANTALRQGADKVGASGAEFVTAIEELGGRCR
ncbi:hypothetical protein [Arenivirga flava]|uniref:Uncharacterized protein n=1 Tax=Arenivirga flava TaxID=1930060 RepID=A0AA37UCP9_9MICO|nr:hypothetical protein [Arenivirga flava]GMA28179.1 hypothetical protein GCM10025874_14320 [Arenivirga flava]